RFHERAIGTLDANRRPMLRRPASLRLARPRRSPPASIPRIMTLQDFGTIAPAPPTPPALVGARQGAQRRRPVGPPRPAEVLCRPTRHAADASRRHVHARARPRRRHPLRAARPRGRRARPLPGERGGPPAARDRELLVAGSGLRRARLPPPPRLPPLRRARLRQELDRAAG